MWSTWLLIVGSAVAVTAVAAYTSSIYLHRAMAHRALTLHPVADHLCRTIIWLTVGVNRQQWAAVHRKHHTFTDVPGDPHSPMIFGFWRVQFGNFIYYLREARRPEVVQKFASDLPPDRWDRWIYTRTWAGVVVGTGTIMLLLGWWQGLLVSAIHGVVLTLVLTPLINGLAHWHGEQPYENSARNIPWLVWVTAGESLHNNHHARPRSAKTSMAPGEFDPGWSVIQFLQRIGMVTSVRRG
ncbi:MAG TPA: fatty acid desaturase [Candidatus Bathyarchaeia archaeon]|nr:fatty acid desaturase [Candidatus Bathyarchaeia archaeon]